MFATSELFSLILNSKNLKKILISCGSSFLEPCQYLAYALLHSLIQAGDKGSNIYVKPAT